MPLTKSPILTSRKLAANRANARRSTGPRTYRGKCRVTLNALRHGRYASRLFRSHLQSSKQNVDLYDWIYAQVRECHRPVNRREWQSVEDAARGIWCILWQSRREGLKAGLIPPTRSSVWCVLRFSRRFRAAHMQPEEVRAYRLHPRIAVQSTGARVLLPTSIRVPLGCPGVQMTFWVRRRRRELPLRALLQELLRRRASQRGPACPPPASEAQDSGTKPRCVAESQDPRITPPPTNCAEEAHEEPREVAPGV